jgi:NAD(P)-dependent dehydrogenase (short-subunit alcohol dehydrogenase family)
MCCLPPAWPRSTAARMQADGMAAAMRQMIALGRVGAPEEAAGAMLLLASPYASYITGQAVEVTGGGWL